MTASARRRDVAGRVLDLVVAAVGSVVTLPLVVVLLGVSAVTLRTPAPLFTHERIGRDGRRFRFVKIRTLPPAVDPYQCKTTMLAETPAVLRMVRRSHLDELPQLWLVLAGRMALVGPRPEMPHLHERFPADVAAERTSVRPGVTGLWQVGPHHHLAIAEHPEYDRFHVRHRSLALDAWVLWATVRKVVLGRTSALDAVPAWARRDVVPAAGSGAGQGPGQLEPVVAARYRSIWSRPSRDRSSAPR